MANPSAAEQAAGTATNNAGLSAAAKIEEKKKAEAYNGDEALKRLGASEGNKCDPSSSFDTFMRQIKSDKTSDFLWLQRQVKAISEMEDKGEDRKAVEETRKTCERVLAEYLYETGKKMNEKFFFILVIFVRAYKDCMNEYGWEIVRKYRQVTAEDRKKEFVTNNDAEHIPDACNDFVRYYLPKEYPAFDKSLSIELTRHLCEWAKKNKYTHTCISLI